MSNSTTSYDTIIIGGGQAGLSVGYYLRQQGRDFVILDASERVGDAWRKRWDSLRLFTPARYNGLSGMPFPADDWSFPTKDEMADFLEAYAARFALPVRTSVRVERLARQGGRFVATADERRFEADNVVVAMSNWQKPRVPSFAPELDPNIVQLHSNEYRNPSQLQDGGILVVGAGNSGAEIALDVANGHRTWLSGRDTGHIPFHIESVASRFLLVPLVLRFIFHRLLTVDTPIGRKKRREMLSSGHGMPLVRTKPRDIAAAAIQRVPRVEGVQDGLPLLEDGRTLEVANVIWCTGFHPGFASWIDLPIFGEDGEPRHERGVVASQPGLYFVGLHFLYAASSGQIHGMVRDAAFIADKIVARSVVATAATVAGPLAAS